VEPSEPRDAPPPGESCLGFETLDRLRRHEVPADDIERSRRDAASAHLARCSVCRDRLDDLRETHEFIAEFTAARRPATHSAPERRDDAALSDDFPGYAIEAVINVGGQGAVYRARQSATGRLVAIKVPLGDGVQRPAARYRFRREIELTARLSHPAIVRVLGVCEAPQGRVGCVMELVDGRRFDAWAESQRADGRAGRRRIVAAVRRIAEAIAYAHQRAVLHRDLKPSNVVMDRDGAPRILDFGLAKALDQDAGSFVTATGTFIGTLAHAAPEQVGGSTDGTDVRTDVHGIGLLLYLALAGRLPWDAEASSSELIRQIRDGASRRPTTESGMRDDALDAIVLKAISKSKDRRYATATELVEDLDRWLGNAPVRARFDGKGYVLRTVAWRHRYALGVAVLVLATVTTLAALWLDARASELRADLIAAMRDAGIVATHWATVAEAREAARDGFVRGERVLWEILLRSEPALIAAGLEGAEPLGSPRGDEAATPHPLPTSPAYWGLWELYARTPVVASLPITASAPITFARHEPWLVDSMEGCLRLWDWRRGTLVRRIELPPDSKLDGALPVIAGHRALLRGATGPPIMVDLVTGESRDISSASATSTKNVAVGERTLVRVGGTSTGQSRLELLEIGDRDLRLRSTHTIPFAPSSIQIDRSERLVAVASATGELIAIDAQSGRELLRRSRHERPLYRWVRSRGLPGELILFGDKGHAVLQLDGDSAAVGEFVPLFGGTAIDGIAQLEPSPVGPRYAVVTSRMHAHVGTVDDAPDRARLIPALRARSGSLSADGRHLALALSDEPRAAIVDLDATTVRRLLVDGTADGGIPATIFASLFDQAGGSVVAGVIDGSVVRFRMPIASNSPDASPESVDLSPARRSVDRWGQSRRAEYPRTFVTLAGTKEHQLDTTDRGGITRFASDGEGLIVGTHDMGRNDAALLRLEGGRVTTLLDDGLAWICGIAVEPGDSIWALAGDGRLVCIDHASGTIRRETFVARQQVLANARAMARLRHRGLLVVGPAGPGVQILDEITLEPVAADLAVNPVQAIVVSPTDPDLLVTTHDNGFIRLWRIAEAASDDGVGPTQRRFRIDVTLVREMGAHAGPVFCAAFHPAGRILVTGGGAAELRDVRFWDIEHGRELAALSLFDNGVFTVSFSPDGRWIVAGGEVAHDGAREGGQLYLIDLAEPERCFAGNLEYHIDQWIKDHGRPPATAEALRARFPNPFQSPSGVATPPPASAR